MAVSFNCIVSHLRHFSETRTDLAKKSSTLLNATQRENVTPQMFFLAMLFSQSNRGIS